MKLLSFAAIVAGAGIGMPTSQDQIYFFYSMIFCDYIAQVLAAPLLLIPTNGESTSFRIRFGHAVPACLGKASFITPAHPVMKFHHMEGKVAGNGEMRHRKFRFGHAVPVRHGKHSFVNRIHHSLMHLGRWEGRAVAFVLGETLSSHFFFSLFSMLNDLIQAAEWEFSSG